MKILLSSIIIAIFFTGCIQAQQSTPAPVKKVDAKPDWINGSEGAVGICDSHFRGDAAQEQVAMDRALEKLAKQQKISIRTSSTSSQKEAGGSYASSHASNTSIDADTKVKAHIKNTWRNPNNNRYYIWMVMD
ncbi:MAG: hypothetical protein JJW00_04845 [Sulfurimonas sp.]|nr:hypothetical protein [Sulfurimonas sp.]